MLLLKFVPLLLAGSLAVPCCNGDHVVIDYDCLEVVATGVRDCGSGAVSVAGLQVDSPQGCPKISEFEVVYYKDVDGIPGYANPPDRYVDHRSATIGTPTASAAVGSMSNHSQSNGTADSWSVRVVDENGAVTTTSGSF